MIHGGQLSLNLRFKANVPMEVSEEIGKHLLEEPSTKDIIFEVKEKGGRK